jgi:uroporphyrinogen decarboxylase
MISRDRVIRAITFNNPDRIPVDLWTLPSVYLKHGDTIDRLLKENPIDFAHSEWAFDKTGPRYKVGLWEDEWGCVWRNEKPGIIGQVIKHPLEDYRALKDFKPPVEFMEKTIKERLRNHPDPNKFWLGNGGDFFHRMTYLRGMENVMIDIMEGSPELERLKDILFDFYMRQVSIAAESGVDGICFFDDWGSQRQLLVSPEIWRSFIKPVYQELFAICKSKGKFIFFHSDGYIIEIINDFIELGVDVINSQVWCMGPEVLGSRFRGKITFWGEISRQDTLPHGTPAEIYDSARKMKQHLATERGGLIGQGEIDDLTSLENIKALLSVWNS